MTTLAAIQMASGPRLDANLAEAARLLRDAANAGAKLAVLPEYFAQFGLPEAERGAYAPEEEMAYRRGFEAALTQDAPEPGRDADPAYRRGWERGRAYRGDADHRLPKSA